MAGVSLHRGDRVSRFLRDADPALGEVIDRVGRVEFTPPADRFGMLVRGIVGQQLSQASARAIFERLTQATELTPRGVLEADDATLRRAGLSARKSEYVRGVAQAVVSGELDLDALAGCADGEVIERLTRLRGIGPWSAQMFAIIALGCPDILPTGDVGVRASAGAMLGLDRPATPAELEERAERWRPHRSAASLYLMVDRAPRFPAVAAPTAARPSRTRARTSTQAAAGAAVARAR